MTIIIEVIMNSGRVYSSSELNTEDAGVRTMLSCIEQLDKLAVLSLPSNEKSVNKLRGSSIECVNVVTVKD